MDGKYDGVVPLAIQSLHPFHPNPIQTDPNPIVYDMGMGWVSDKYDTAGLQLRIIRREKLEICVSPEIYLHRELDTQTRHLYIEWAGRNSAPEQGLTKMISFPLPVHERIAAIIALAAITRKA